MPASSSSARLAGARQGDGGTAGTHLGQLVLRLGADLLLLEQQDRVLRGRGSGKRGVRIGRVSGRRLSRRRTRWAPRGRTLYSSSWICRWASARKWHGQQRCRLSQAASARLSREGRGAAHLLERRVVGRVEVDAVDLPAERVEVGRVGRRRQRQRRDAEGRGGGGDHAAGVREGVWFGVCEGRRRADQVLSVPLAGSALARHARAASSGGADGRTQIDPAWAGDARLPRSAWRPPDRRTHELHFGRSSHASSSCAWTSRGRRRCEATGPVRVLWHSWCAHCAGPAASSSSARPGGVVRPAGEGDGSGPAWMQRAC